LNDGEEHSLNRWPSAQLAGPQIGVKGYSAAMPNKLTNCEKNRNRSATAAAAGANENEKQGAHLNKH